jgi:hypothetical protein
MPLLEGNLDGSRFGFASCPIHALAGWMKATRLGRAMTASKKSFELEACGARSSLRSGESPSDSKPATVESRFRSCLAQSHSVLSLLACRRTHQRPPTPHSTSLDPRNLAQTPPRGIHHSIFPKWSGWMLVRPSRRSGVSWMGGRFYPLLGLRSLAARSDEWSGIGRDGKRRGENVLF